MDDAILGKATELHTPPLYTDPFGYKFSAKIKLNGDEEADEQSKGKYVALYIYLSMGDFDEALQWPFPYDTELTLMDQCDNKCNVIKTVENDPSGLPFKKPEREMSPSVGFPLFVSHQDLYNGNYIRDDTLFIKIEVLQKQIVGHQ